MNIFLLGCLLSVYITIIIVPVDCSQIVSVSDSNITESTEDYDYVFNCTQCNVKSKRTELCRTCCFNESNSDNQCCFCHDCSLCWNTHWEILMVTQITISVVFGFGIITLIIIYWGMCKKSRQLTSERCTMLQQEQETSMYCNTIEGMRERPPPYSEVCSAPPVFISTCNSASSLYAVLYNRACMQEAPPSYPETPKLEEKTRGSNEPASSPSSILDSIRHM